MKKTQSSLLFYFVLIFLMVFSSCATHHQVACPSPQQNKYLAKNVDKIHTKTSKRRTASRTKHFTANKLSKNVQTIPVVKPTINYTDIDPVSSIEAQMITETSEDLIASSKEAVYLDPIDKINRVSQDNVPVDASAPAVELMTKKEQKQFTFIIILVIMD